MKMYKCDVCGAVCEGKGFNGDNPYPTFTSIGGQTYAVNITVSRTASPSDICAECVKKTLEQLIQEKNIR